MDRKRLIFYSLWLVLVLIGPITVLRNTPLSLAISNQAILINVLQRITGLLAFTLLFVQIILGAFMTKLTEKLGGWIFKFHLNEGALAYILVLAHPLLFVFLNFKITGKFDPFYVFTDFCVICKNNLEYFYTLGRVSFWLITIAVAAAKLRTQPWLQRHWLKFHVLNYIAFFFIAIHSWNVGTDTRTPPFVWFYWTAIAGAFIALSYKRLIPLVKNFMPKKRVESVPQNTP